MGEVVDQPGVDAFPVGAGAQGGGGVDRGKDQSSPGRGAVPPPRLDDRRDLPAAFGADPEARSQQGPPGGRPQGDHQFGLHGEEFLVQPGAARGDLAHRRGLVHAPLARLFGLVELEVLDGVGEPQPVAVETGLGQGPVQQPPGRAHERRPLPVLLVAGLLAHQHQPGVLVARAEDRPGGPLVQGATAAAGRRLREAAEIGAGGDEGSGVPAARTGDASLRRHQETSLAGVTGAIRAYPGRRGAIGALGAGVPWSARGRRAPGPSRRWAVYCELMAEYQDEPRDPPVARWHVVRQDQHAALCGHVLARDAWTLPIAVPYAGGQGEVCPACWSRYRTLS